MTNGRSRPSRRSTFGAVSANFYLDDYFGQLGIGEDKITHTVPKVCSFNIQIA